MHYVIFLPTDQQNSTTNGNFSLDLVETNITTPLHESLCGITFNTSETYLIFGHIQNGRLVVNLCNYILPWKETSNQIKAGIYGDFDCRCNIETRIKSTSDISDPSEMTNEKNNGASPVKTSSTCIWEMYPDEPIDECALNFLTCRKLVNAIEVDNEKKECVWIQARSFEMCNLAASPVLSNNN